MGAGGLPTARASSTSSQAWIYTDDLRDSTPSQITGSISLHAVKAATMSADKADASASFTWKGAKYTVRVDCPFPVVGQDFSGRGPVQFMRPVLGLADMGTLNLPETHAHVAVYGRSTIMRDGKMIAEGQPTAVLVTQAIHGSDRHYLSSPDTSRNEIQLIVPGPLDGQKFVSSFPKGYLYVYWPDAKLTMTGNVKPTPMTTATPMQSGRGPATPSLGTESPRGTIAISLTNTGIVKEIGQSGTGLYDLNITNNSSRRRGLMITGTDLCCTLYTRFSRILRPGESQVFRWYFAPGKAQLKDFTSARKTKTAYANVKLGGHSSSIMFD